MCHITALAVNDKTNMCDNTSFQFKTKINFYQKEKYLEFTIQHYTYSELRE